MNDLSTMTCSTGTLRRLESGVIVIDQTPRALQTWDSAVELLRGGVQLASGKKGAMVVLANESRTDRGARRAFQEVGGELCSCVAMVVKSRVSEVTGNFFLKINSPKYAMRLFKDVDSASEWATSFVGQPLGPGASQYLP